MTSGTVCRIEPIIPPRATTLPGEGKEPAPPTPDIRNSPIVAIIDGGLTARTYRVAVAWEPPPFVPAHLAASKHGNQVASLVVNATGWNNNLDIPNHPCRIAPIQAAPINTIRNYYFDEDAFFAYLNELIVNNPETKVWNFSLNQPIECDPDSISSLGDGINTLARQHSILPIISAGNIHNGQRKIAPPADCESAIVVAGRTPPFSASRVNTYCSISRGGLGPYNSLRPDISWYSEVRVIGGDIVKGTSYAAPLVSRISAHTFKHIKHATPDLIRAIILNNTDLPDHDHKLGWGSPIRNDTPWNCPDGTVTLVWDSELESGQEYHWNDIHVPPSMIVLAARQN